MTFEPRFTPLPRAFFARPVLRVAEALVGAWLVRRRGRAVQVVRIVETEAYGGVGVDPSAHSYRGMTPRCVSMFEAPGTAYVYATQGRCSCLNVAAGSPDLGGAVLLRAAEPVQGVALMRRRRLARLSEGPTRRRLLAGADHELLRGPGRLCVSLAVDRALDGTDVTAEGRLFLALAERGREVGALSWTPRIGLNSASASFGWHWRAFEDCSRAVSLPRGEVRSRPRPARLPTSPC